MGDVEIRLYEPGDEAAVRRLSERLTEGVAPWRDPAKVATTVASWIDTALEQSDAAGHSLMVAVRNDGVVGFITVEARDHYIDGRDAYIGELAVDDRAEGRGVGQMLVAAATEWARREGCERLTLQTGAANARARGFYEKLGFDYEDVSMARPISSTAER